MNKNLTARFKAKSDKELVNILFFQKEKYELLSLKVARKELNDRKLSNEQLKHLKKELKADEERAKRMEGNNGLSWLATLIDTIFGR